MSRNQEIIKGKIKEFVKKYYLNRFYKGALLFIIITLGAFIAYALLEYFSFFGSAIRLFLFISYLAVFVGTFIFYVAIPISKIRGIGKLLTQRQIAQIIGNHFPEIDDKLLNYFQLEKQVSEGDYKSESLILAAIDNKIDKISPFPFVKAIHFHRTRKYLKWGVLPVLLFIALFSIKSEIFTDSTRRIIHYDQIFEKPAPYKILIQNKNLTAFQNEDYEISVKISGTETPKELFISYNNKKYKCSKQDNTTFYYKLKNLQKSFDFQLQTEETNSPLYTLQVLPKPAIINFVMQLRYPAYLNKMNETIENNGDFTVPEGTEISWRLYTKNTDSVQFISENQTLSISKSDNLFSKTLRATASFDYAIVNSNRYYTSKDTLKYNITVIKDQYPEIFVESQHDSSYYDRVYFKGLIKDDYGFSNLKFVYNKYDADSKLVEANTGISIKFDPHNTIQEFYYYFDAGTLDLFPGERVEYHFEVFDNDGIHGSKMCKSSNYEFKIKTEDEIDSDLSMTNKENKTQLQNLMKESDQLIKEIEKQNQQLMQIKNPTWQEKKKLNDLMKRFSELKQQLKDLNKSQKEQKTVENQFKNYNEDILEKEKELQKRMDDLLSDELKTLMEKMQQMLDQVNKDQMKDAMEKMKSNTEEINKQLEQQLEMYKHLEYEKKYNDLIEKTKKLSQEQEKLAEQTENREGDKIKLTEKQEQLEQKFAEIQKELKELENLNKQLEEPYKMEDKQKLQDDVTNNMQQSKDALNKNQQGKSSEKQKQAAKSLEELSDLMEKELNQNEADQIGEDMESVRQILSNLLKISFRQESNMKKSFPLTSKSSALSGVIFEQKNISAAMKMINDSLSRIAKRQISVRSFILKEATKIREALSLTETNLLGRNLPIATKNQQVALTSMNNLALMLAESLKEMKQKKQESQGKCNKSGNKSCSNQGKNQSKKSGAKRARELQEQLNRQMEAMKRSLQQGKPQQGETQQNSKQGESQQLSEQFAKMAAQQEAIRKMLEEYQNQMKSENGVGSKELDKIIEEMKKTETELVNKTLTEQTISRQQEISTRLLSSEKAEIKRDQEKEREAIEAREVPNPNPPKNWKIDKQSETQTEMIKSIPANINYYYKEKANKYFYNIEQ